MPKLKIAAKSAKASPTRAELEEAIRTWHTDIYVTINRLIAAVHEICAALKSNPASPLAKFLERDELIELLERLSEASLLEPNTSPWSDPAALGLPDLLELAGER